LRNMPALGSAIHETEERLHAPSLFETRLAERAIILIDKLSRCVLHPYIIAENQNNITRNGITPMPLDGFRNDQDGPFVLTRVRAGTMAAPAAAVSGAVFSNVALRIEDVAGNNMLGQDATVLPALFSRVTNTWTLTRPYVIERRGALKVMLTEMNIAATTDVYVAFHGELVLGDMTADEVREAIALGVYPLPGQQAGVWPRFALLESVFGARPPRVSSAQAADALERLRVLGRTIMGKLSAADCSAYVLEARETNITASGVTDMTRNDHRNNQRCPLAITRVVANTAASYSIDPAASPFENVAVSISAIDEGRYLTRDFTLLSTLLNFASGAWVLEHPFVLSPNGSLQVRLQELAGNATTDVHFSFQGEVLRGIEAAELRAAVTLGLYPLQDREYD